MSIPANIQTDLNNLDADITAQAGAQATVTTDTAAVTAAQQQLATDQQALTAAQAKTQTDYQTLLTDLAAWIGGGTPPAAADLKDVASKIKASASKIKK